MARRDVERIPTTAASQPSDTEKDGRSKAKLRSVSVFKLKPHPLQPSDRHSEENVADLLVSIVELGLQEPPLVWRRQDGTYVILIGHRRIRACQLGALEGDLDRKIRVFVRDDLTEGDALKLMAAEYFHRREFSTLHIAELIGETSRHLSVDEDGEISARALAAVLPWGKSSVNNYLTIYRALRDPRLKPLVQRVDGAPISLLCNMLTQEEFSTRVGALEAYAENGAAAAKKAMSSARSTSTGGRPLKTVTRGKRGDGYDVTVRIRPTMTEPEVQEAYDALNQALEDLKTIPQKASVSGEE